MCLIFEIEQHGCVCVEPDLLHHFFKAQHLITKLLSRPDSSVSS